MKKKMAKATASGNSNDVKWRRSAHGVMKKRKASEKRRIGSRRHVVGSSGAEAAKMKAEREDIESHGGCLKHI